jgi:hypothetical protein
MKYVYGNPDLLSRPGVTLIDLYMIDNYDYEGNWVSVLTFANFDAPINIYSTWYSCDLLFKRSSLSWKTGVDVSSVQIECRNDPEASSMLTFIPDLLAGQYDNSIFHIYRMFTDTLNLCRHATLGPYYDVPSPYTNAAFITMFVGRLAGVEGDRRGVTLTVNSAMELLNVKMPKNIFTPSCSRTLFRDGCPVPKDHNTWTGTVKAGATRTSVPIQLSAYPANGFFDNGGMSALDGQPAMIRFYWGDVVVLTRELRSIPAEGTVVSIWPGCDKTLNSCTTKFTNDSGGSPHDFSAYFRGFPWIPVPETAV